MKKREPPYTVGGAVNSYNHYGEQYEGSLKNLEELPQDTTISLLGIYLDKTPIQKDACSLMLTAVLLTTAETWK